MPKTAAFFDVDGTLYNGVISADFLRYMVKNSKLKISDIVKITKFLYYFIIDKFGIINRTEVNLRIYRNIAGWDASAINGFAQEFYNKIARKKFYSGGIRLLNSHLRKGHVVVAVTSGLKNIVTPLRKGLKLEYIIGTEVELENGKFSDRIRILPIGKNRAEIISRYCKSNGIGLERSFAYSDHNSDIFMLQTVGNPVAVNPDKKLEKYAKEKRWKIIRFK